MTARSGAAHGTGSTVSRALAGLSSYSRSTSRFPLDAEERFVNALLEDRYGTLWVGAASGLCRRWPDGTVARYSRTTGLPDDYIHALLADRDGHVWVGTRYGGLLELATDASRRPPTVTRAYNHGNGFIADWIFAVNELEDGRLWVGTNTGLAEFSADDRKRDKPSHVVRQGQRVHLSRDCRRFGGPRRQHLAGYGQRRDEAGPKRLSLVWPGGWHRDRDAAVRARPA